MSSSARIIVVCFLVVLAGTGLFAWNEGRHAARQGALGEAARQVVTIDPVSGPVREGAVALVSGWPDMIGPPKDPRTGVEVPNAVRLIRRVETFQWVERSECVKSVEEKGERRCLETRWDYDRRWVDEPIDSDRFTGPGRTRHRNPVVRFEDDSWNATGVRIGRFRIDAASVAGATDGRPFVPPLETLPRGLRPVDGWLFGGLDPFDPDVGDQRIRYEALVPGQLTVLGAVDGERLVPWTASDGSDIFVVSTGQKTAGQLFQVVHGRAAALTWTLRVLAVLLVAGAVVTAVLAWRRAA